MRCKMKAMIMDMCMLSHKTQCFLMFGHLVGVGAGKLNQTEGFARIITVLLLLLSLLLLLFFVNCYCILL